MVIFMLSFWIVFFSSKSSHSTAGKFLDRTQRKQKAKKFTNNSSNYSQLTTQYSNCFRKIEPLSFRRAKLVNTGEKKRCLENNLFKLLVLFNLQKYTWKPYSFCKNYIPTSAVNFFFKKRLFQRILTLVSYCI